jgi:hypothetical protein
MQTRLCAASKSDGTSCRAVAVTGSILCGAHRKLSQRYRRIARSRRPSTIRLGPLQDRDSVQRALGRVAQAIASGSLNLERAAAMVRRLQAALILLDRRESIQPQPASPWLFEVGQ